MTKQGGAVASPLRLEAKDDYKRRFRKSPNEADACALCALAVKERVGVDPFGSLPSVAPSALVATAPVKPRVSVPRNESWAVDPLDGETGFTTPS